MEKIQQVIVQEVSKDLKPYLKYRDGNFYSQVISDAEKAVIHVALTQCEGHQINAAKFLGLNRNTLRKKINDYGIDIEPYAYGVKRPLPVCKN